MHSVDNIIKLANTHARTKVRSCAHTNTQDVKKGSSAMAQDLRKRSGPY